LLRRVILSNRETQQIAIATFLVAYRHRLRAGEIGLLRTEVAELTLA
jgi:hypothetical protein